MKDYQKAVSMAETIELMLLDLIADENISPYEVSVCQSAIRTAWVRAAQTTLIGILERKDVLIFKVLPHLKQVWENRYVFHEYNMIEYYKQIDRFCSYLTLDQARKYALCDNEDYFKD